MATTLTKLLISAIFMGLIGAYLSQVTFGQKNVSVVDAKGSSTDQEAERYIKEVAKSLGINPEFVVVNHASKKMEAFAALGTIHLSSNYAQASALLPYVLAHEFAHISLGHTRILTGEEKWSKTREIGASVTKGSENPYHKDEQDADSLAVVLVCEKLPPCDADAFAAFLEHSEESLTHPGGKQRAQRVRELASALKQGAGFIVSPANTQPGSFAAESNGNSLTLERSNQLYNP